MREFTRLPLCVLTSDILRLDLCKHYWQSPLSRNYGKVASSPRERKVTTHKLDSTAAMVWGFFPLLLLSSLNSKNPENPFTKNRFSSMISGFEVGKK